MQFKEGHREQLKHNWGPHAWFYQALGSPARGVISKAYGTDGCHPHERALAQEYLTLTLSLFARKVGAEKSHVVHALLTDSVESLQEAIFKREGINVTADKLAEALQDAFREVAGIDY